MLPMLSFKIIEQGWNVNAVNRAGGAWWMAVPPGNAVPFALDERAVALSVVHDLVDWAI